MAIFCQSNSTFLIFAVFFLNWSSQLGWS